VEREENLVAAFRYLDKDNSGYLTIEELQNACEEFNMGEVKMEELMRDVDQDNDGRIDYHEFVTMMRKGETGGVASRKTKAAEATFNFADAMKVRSFDFPMFCIEIVWWKYE
jgi:calcium-dependent protein kinase